MAFEHPFGTENLGDLEEFFPEKSNLRHIMEDYGLKDDIEGRRMAGSIGIAINILQNFVWGKYQNYERIQQAYTYMTYVSYEYFESLKLRNSSILDLLKKIPDLWDNIKVPAFVENN